MGAVDMRRWLLTLGCLSVLAAISEASSVNTLRPGPKALVARLDTTMIGNDVGSFFFLQPELACFLACQETAGCVAFVFEVAVGECSLKTATAAAKGTPSSQEGTFAVDLNGGILSPWTSMEGYDLGSVFVMDLGACLAACSAKSECLAVVWHPMLGDCDLKSTTCNTMGACSEPNKVTIDSSVVEFVGDGANPAPLVVRMGVTILGNDESSPRPHPELRIMDCLVECYNHTACQSIVFVVSTQQCLLKSSTCEASPLACISNEGTDQMDLNDAQVFSGKFATNAKLIQFVPDQDLSGCLELCGRTSGCQSVSFFRPRPFECHLQTAVCGSADEPACDFVAGALFDTIDLGSEGMPVDMR